MKLLKFKTILSLCFTLVTFFSQAQITVNSLSELLPYLDDDNVEVKLAPGTYNVTTTNIEDYLFSAPFNGETIKSLLLISGNNSTYDFTDVTINIDTKTFQSIGYYEFYQIRTVGNNNVLKNLTLVDVGSEHDFPADGTVNLVMDGKNNRIEGFHVTSTGSKPYGYGDAFGKGGTNTVIGHKKHSTFLIRGDYNHAKGCTLIHRTYGHCIFMQAADHPTIEDCYIEGEMRSTDDMLAEEGTGSDADDVDFMTTWGYRLPPGYMMSLGEEGIRAYNGGRTVIDGIEYEYEARNVTVKNCTVKNMRGGVTLSHAGGYNTVDNCTIIGCEGAFGIANGGSITNCYADAAFGPIFGSAYNSDNNCTIDVTIIPAENNFYYNGSNCLTYLGGYDHNLTLRSTDPYINPDLNIQVGGFLNGLRIINGSNPSQNNHDGRYNDIVNQTRYPVILPSNSYNNTVQSCGTVTNSGSNNSVTYFEDCENITDVTCTKTTALTEAECFDEMSGVVVEASGNTGGENLGYINDNDWARYNDIDLTNMDSFNAFVSTTRTGTSVEIRLNSTTGTLIGTLSVPNNGEWHSYSSLSTPISSESGTHDIFLVFKGGNLNIGSFGFTGSNNDPTDCAGVVNGTASIDDCGVCSGGSTGINPSSPQTWYEDTDGDGIGEANSSVQDCDQPSGYVASAGDNCPNDANKTNPESCGCGVVEGTCSGCTKTTEFTEAECFDEMSGVVVEASGNTGGENLGYLDNNDWARYNDIDLTNMDSFNALVSTTRTGTSVEIRLNSTTGTLIGTLPVPNNGEWHSYSSLSTPISSVSGTQDVFLIFKGGAFNIGSFGFTGSSSDPTDCAGVVNGTASVDDCGVCSGGSTGINPSSPQTWYEDTDGDGIGEASSSVQDCDQPSGYVATAGDNCPNDANKTNPESCGCGVVEGTCSGCTKTTTFTEAECFDEMSGVVIEPSGSTGEENLGYINNNDWARYNDINLSNMNSFNAFVSTIRTGTSVEVRLNSTTGTLLGTLSVPNNGAWHSYSSISTPISIVSGTHDVFLVFKGGNLNIGSFGFSDEDIVEPSDCSTLTGNVSIGFTNPTCSNNNGSVTVSFPNSSDYSQLELSIDGGSSYPVTVNDNSGSYTFTGLSEDQYEIAVRYSNNVCEYNIGHLYLVQDCDDIPFTPGGTTWMDSYEANGHCWCNTNFDHDLDEEGAIINGTRYSVVDICDELEDHPLYRTYSSGDNIYNDIQCGNGPINTSYDEPLCPGRVDLGTDGCLETGEHWDMEWLASRDRFGASNAKIQYFNFTTEETVLVHPSVANDKIEISGISVGETFTIFSFNGIIVKEGIYFGNIDVNDLNQGVYIVMTNYGNARFIKE